MSEGRSKKPKTLSSNGTSVGELAKSSRAANVYRSSFRRTKNPIIGFQLFVQICRFLKYPLNFWSCHVKTWVGAKSHLQAYSQRFLIWRRILVSFRSGTWPSIATSCRHSHPVRRLCLPRRSSLHHEASSVEYVVFDWPNMVYYVPIPQRDHGTVASLDTRHWIPEC